MEVLTKLQIGIKAYYEDEVYSEDGELLIDKIKELGLTLDDYNLCIKWLDYYQDYHMYDTVNYGCDCGCGGDSMDIDYVEEMEEIAWGGMGQIEKLLGEPPEEYLS